MSIAFSQAKLKGAERKAILQAIETQMQQVIIEGVPSTGNVPTVAVPMPTSSLAMTIIAVVWKPDGGTWTWCGCPCWNASAVSTTW